jgi:uncharacterized membrane protein YiaA
VIYKQFLAKSLQNKSMLTRRLRPFSLSRDRITDIYRSIVHSMSDLSYSKDEIPVRYLPVLLITWVVTLIIVTGVLYATDSDPTPSPGQFPTISYTAMGFPANRLFAVGLAIISFLIVPIGIIESDVFHFWNAPIIGNLILYTSFITSILLFLIGQFNLAEIPLAHNLISWFGFCFVIVLNLLSVIGEIRTDQEKLTGVKLSCITVPICNLIGLAFISQIEENELRFNLLGVFEYVVVIGACVGTALYYFNFRRIQVLISVEMPREDRPDLEDLPKDLIEGEIEQGSSIS